MATVHREPREKLYSSLRPLISVAWIHTNTNEPFNWENKIREIRANSWLKRFKWMTQRWIMHLDIDAFFASIEKVRNPHLIGKPVIVGSGVIASCCYTARRHGLSAGMNLSEARRICPQVIILAGNYPVYKAFAERIWEICHDITPAVDTLLDDAYLDLTGVTRLYGSLLQMAQKLQAHIREVTGLAVTLGLGTSRTVARLASAAGKPNGVRLVEAGSERAFLADLPVEKLPGVGRKRAEILHKLNIHTIGALADLPAGSLEQIFGATGTALYEYSRGRDSQVLNANEIPRTISRETSFHADTIDRSKIEAMLYYLTERAMKTLRELELLTKPSPSKSATATGPATSRPHVSRRQPPWTAKHSTRRCVCSIGFTPAVGRCMGWAWYCPIFRSPRPSNRGCLITTIATASICTSHWTRSARSTATARWWPGNRSNF